MNLKEAMAELEAMGDEGRRKHNAKTGPDGIPGAPPEKQFGCKTGDIRALAKRIKADHDLAMQLWKTGNLDAQLLAILLMKPKQISAEDIDRMVREARFTWVADWFNAYIVKTLPEAQKAALRDKWMNDKDPWAARAGWNLLASRINAGEDGLDLPGILDRIEKEMPKAPPETKWTMNAALAAIGINHATLRERAIAIGERLGVYRDYPCSKGCTSPFAPIWINEMVKRKA
jgi:3-methyladenine DNA glycosylase AlkD